MNHNLENAIIFSGSRNKAFVLCGSVSTHFRGRRENASAYWYLTICGLAVTLISDLLTSNLINSFCVPQHWSCKSGEIPAKQFISC